MKRRFIELILVMLVTIPFFYLSIVLVAKASGEAEKAYLKYDVNIFSEQNFEGKLIKSAEIGTSLTVIKKDGDWINIRTSDEKIGWVHKNWVTGNREKLRKEIIKDLEAKVKPIPAYNINGNLKIYKKLLKLDPNNIKYKEKVAYYSSKLEEKKKRREQLRAGSDLELLNWHWSEDCGYVKAQGQVKNISGRKLERVEALVTWYDKNGNMITSDSSLIEYDPILPGQVSPFKVMERYNPAMKKASIEFKFMWGNKIPTYSK